MPLTHRDHAQGVLFVTGHARETALTPRLAGASARAPTRWSTIAAAAADGITVVIYMGIATAPELQAALSLRLAGSTPVAIVQHATLPAQRSVVCRLDNLAATIAAEGLGSPAIVVVGDVVRAAELAQGANVGTTPMLAQANA